MDREKIEAIIRKRFLELPEEEVCQMADRASLSYTYEEGEQKLEVQIPFVPNEYDLWRMQQRRFRQ